ncbi:MAG TPA: 50S ribosomal protein L25/general stress protein Ctc [Desulfonatronum sp.]|nr:50S ribosomal protein L25/general stress protein Ctc [Desulfonatronum sp.]
MSDQSRLNVDVRSEKGSGNSRRLRKKSLVPGVYYNAKGENIPFSVESTPLQKLYAKAGHSQVFQLEIREQDQSREQPAIIRDVQFHPVKGIISHVDFYGVDLARKINVYIPVEVVGKAKGTVVGGVLEIFRDELEVVGLPLAIPEKIVIDVTHLDLNHNLHIQDLSLPEDVEFVFDDNFAVVGVISPAVEAQPEEEEPVEETPAA